VRRSSQRLRAAIGGGARGRCATFVYLDPPYDPVIRDVELRQLHRRRFTWDDQSAWRAPASR